MKRSVGDAIVDCTNLSMGSGSLTKKAATRRPPAGSGLSPREELVDCVDDALVLPDPLLPPPPGACLGQGRVAE